MTPDRIILQAKKKKKKKKVIIRNLELQEDMKILKSKHVDKSK